MGILDNDPQAASTLGSHGRSTIWMCAQHSDCPFRSKILPPLLVIHGADVNRKATGNTPLHSLYTEWQKRKEHQHTRDMAVALAQVCHAVVPYNDRNREPIEMQEWLSVPQLNLEILE